MVVLLVLIGLAIAGLLAQRGHSALMFITEDKVAFWGPLAVAALLWVSGVAVYLINDQLFFDWAHGASAIGLFFFIVVAIFVIAWNRGHGSERYEVAKDPRWAWGYFALGLAMSAGVTFFYFIVRAIDGGEIDRHHATFWVEAWMIAFLAVFWVLQTWERWHDGAPPRTEAEKRLTKPA